MLETHRAFSFLEMHEDLSTSDLIKMKKVFDFHKTNCFEYVQTYIFICFREEILYGHYAKEHLNRVCKMLLDLIDPYDTEKFFPGWELDILFIFQIVLSNIPRISLACS